MLVAFLAWVWGGVCAGVGKGLCACGVCWGEGRMEVRWQGIRRALGTAVRRTVLQTAVGHVEGTGDRSPAQRGQLLLLSWRSPQLLAALFALLAICSSTSRSPCRPACCKNNLASEQQ